MHGKTPSVRFSNPYSNAVIYFYFLINSSEGFTEEEEKGGVIVRIRQSPFELLE